MIRIGDGMLPEVHQFFISHAIWDPDKHQITWNLHRERVGCRAPALLALGLGWKFPGARFATGEKVAQLWADGKTFREVCELLNLSKYGARHYLRGVRKSVLWDQICRLRKQNKRRGSP